MDIVFESSGIRISGNKHTTVLEQAEQAGLDIPSSCLSGYCGECKVQLKRGEVEVLEDEGLLPHEKNAGYILACSSLPKTDLVICEE